MKNNKVVTKKAIIRWKENNLTSIGLMKDRKYINCTLKVCRHFKTEYCGRWDEKKCPGLYLDAVNEPGVRGDLSRCGWALKILSIPLQDYGIYRLNGGRSLRIKRSVLKK